MERGQATVVFNGEIYNFRELRRELEADGYAFVGDSDTEVLLVLYAARGEAMLPLLNGIFAFAIYDQRADTLFLACDDMAVKPLYFTEGPNGFLFASELKAMLRDPGLSRAIDVRALFRILGFLWSPGGSSPLHGVQRLGPGEALRVSESRVVRHWKWAGTTWAPETAELDSGGAVRDVRNALRTAVHRQMVSDVPVGAFLSGGLDSSAVVAMARETTPAIECFTIDAGGVNDGGGEDDLPYARQVARHLHVKLHEVRIDATSMASNLEQMIFQLDEPLADPAPLNVLFISRLARQHGMKVLLSGAGGDDVFTGYRRHRALRMERFWAWLPLAARTGLRQASSALPLDSAQGRRIRKALAHADSSESNRLIGYFLWGDQARVRGLFAQEHQHALAGESIGRPLQEFLETLPAGLSPMQKMLAMEQRFFLADHNLLYTDKMSMAAGVEVRVPFLDKDLVRLANALPTGFKQRGAGGKWVLRRAMEPYLPSAVIQRPKTGFGAPVRSWLRQELRELVDDTLSADALRVRGLFDPPAVAKLVADDRAGRVDAAYTILGLVSIEVWCRQFLGQGRTSVAPRERTVLGR